VLKALSKFGSDLSCKALGLLVDVVSEISFSF